MCLLDVGTHPFAQPRFTAPWWAPLTARFGQSVVVAVGATIHMTRLHGRYDECLHAARGAIDDAVEVPCATR